MAWQVVGNSGRTYDFEDGVDERLALRYVQDQEKPATWWDTIASVPTAIKAGLAKDIAGPVRAFADLTGNDALAKESEGAIREANKDVAANTPQNMSLLQEGVSSGLSSLPEAAALTAGGAVLGGARLIGGLAKGVARGAAAADAAGFATNAVLGGMGAAEASRTYGESRQEGMGVGASAGKSILSGAAEIVGERFSNKPFRQSLEHILTTGKMPGFKKYIAELLGREVVGEELTTALQFANDYAWSDQKMTVKEAAVKLAHDMAVTAIATGVSAPLQTGAYGSLSKLTQVVGAPADAVVQAPQIAPVAAPVAPPQIDSPVPQEVVKTRSAQPMVYDPVSGSFKGQDTVDIMPSELPFDQRLEMLRAQHEDMKATESQLSTMIPGFNATAEELIALKGMRQAFEAKQQEYGVKAAEIAQEVVTDPTLMKFVAQKDFDSAIMPNISQQLQVAVAQVVEAHGNAFSALGRDALGRASPTVLGGAVAEDKFPYESQAPVLSTKLENTLGQPGIEMATVGGGFFNPWAPINKSGPGKMATNERPDWLLQAVERGIDPVMGVASPRTFVEVLGSMQPGEVAVVEAPGFPANKQGMFQGTQGISPVDSVPFTHDSPADVRQMGQIKELYSGLIRALMPEAKLIIAAVAASHPVLNGANSFITWADDAFVVMLPKMQHEFSLTTAVHEFGHALSMQLFKNASPVEKTALVDGYRNTLEDLLDMTYEDGIKRLMAPVRAHSLLSGLTPAELNAPFYEMLAKKGGSRISIRDTYAGYYLSFDEYFAEQFLKYFHTRGGVVEAAIPLYKRMIMALAKMFKAVKHFAPEASYAAWVDNLILKNQGSEVQTSHTSFAKLKADLVGKGIHPSIVDSMRMPGSEAIDIDFARELLKVSETAQVRDGGLQSLGFSNAALLAMQAMQKTLLDAKAHHALTSDAIFSRLAVAAKKVGAFRIEKDIRDLSQNPFFKGRRIDAPMLIATVMNRVGNWRVTKEQVNETSQGVQQILLQGSVGSPTSAPMFSVVMDIEDGYAVRIGLRGASSTAPVAAFAALQSLARNGAKGFFAAGQQSALVSAMAQLAPDTGNVMNEIPYWAYASKDTQDLADMIPSMAQVGRAFGLGQSKANSMARFNSFLGSALGAFQMAKLNAHIPGATEMLSAFRNRMWYKSQWTRQANTTLEAWKDGLPKDQVEALSRLLYDEAADGDAATTQAERLAAWKSAQLDDPDKPGRKAFILRPEAIRTYKLSEKAQEVYSMIRGDYMASLDEMEKIGMTEIAGAHLDKIVQTTMQEQMRQGAVRADLFATLMRFIDGTPTMPGLAATQPDLALKVKGQVKELQTQFEEMREKPYTPYPRFGQYAAIVHDDDKKVLHFETFESKIAREQGYDSIQKEFAAHRVSKTYIEDLPYTLAGMPQAFLEAVSANLNLSPEQLTQYRDLQMTLSHANSFVKHMKKRKGTSGYSDDAVRGYAEYMRRFANHLARIKAAPEINAALDQMKLEGDLQASTDGGDATKVKQLHEWFSKTNKYINEPGAELGSVKSFVSLWHFGFNISSAVTNSLQVAIATLPYLAERHGWKETAKELKRAYSDLRYWKNMDKLEPDMAWALNHGLETGFLDESFATTLAQTADGTRLSKFAQLTSLRRGVAGVNHYAMWMFQKAEEVNRRTSFIAAFRLAKMQKMDNESAFDYARSAVETTQGEYAYENRPAFMRGNWSLIFQFMQYSQTMIFNMLGGDASWRKMLLVQLMFGGIMGLPFAEDAKNALKFLSRKWGFTETDVELMARESLAQHDINADLILRGFANNIMSLDMAQRVSLGDVIPGMKALGSARKFNEVMSDAATDTMGPGFGLLVNVMRFIGEDDPNSMKHLLSIAPSAVRNLGRGVMAELDGGVKDRDGALLYNPTTWQAAGYAAGFMPKELSTEYAARTMANEEGVFWTRRRSTLMETYRYIALQRGGDAEELGALYDRIIDFNASAPDPKLVISQKALRQSLKSEAKSVARREAGLGANPSTSRITQEVRSAYSQ